MGVFRRRIDNDNAQPASGVPSEVTVHDDNAQSTSVVPSEDVGEEATSSSLQNKRPHSQDSDSDDDEPSTKIFCADGEAERREASTSQAGNKRLIILESYVMVHLDQYTQIIFVDLDNWKGFFQSLPEKLPQQTFVWGFVGESRNWREPTEQVLVQ